MSIAPELQSRLTTAFLLISGIVVVGFLAELIPYGKSLYLILTVLVAGASFHEYGKASSLGESMLSYKRAYLWRGGALVSPLAFTLLSFFTWNRPELLSFKLSVSPNSAIFLSLLGFIVSVLWCSLMLVVHGRNDRLIAIEVAKDLPLASLLFGCGLNSLTLLLLFPGGYKVLLFGLLIVCFSDSAAYFGGKKLQGAKLAPALSPNKTISGSLCGIVSGALIALITGPLLLPLSVWFGAVIGSFLAVVGQGGDLIKSYLKRLHGVKDFGAFLPGHGGALDRLDGIFATAPLLVLLAYCLLGGNG